MSNDCDKTHRDIHSDKGSMPFDKIQPQINRTVRVSSLAYEGVPHFNLNDRMAEHVADDVFRQKGIRLCVITSNPT